MATKKPYRVDEIVDANQVPSWRRRQPKWEELTEQVLKLKPGQSLPVRFETRKSATMARNAVRDAANLRLKKPLIQTRMVTEDEVTTLYLTRLYENKT